MHLLHQQFCNFQTQVCLGLIKKFEYFFINTKQMTFFLIELWGLLHQGHWLESRLSPAFFWATSIHFWPVHVFSCYCLSLISVLEVYIHAFLDVTQSMTGTLLPYSCTSRVFGVSSLSRTKKNDWNWRVKPSRFPLCHILTAVFHVGQSTFNCTSLFLLHPHV